MEIFYLFCTHTHTHTILQNTHINLSILYIYSIEYSFFYNFLLFPHYPSLSHTYHQPTQPPSSPTQTPSSRKAKYPKPHSTQRKAKSAPFNPKPTDQTTRNKGKRLATRETLARDWSDQRSAIGGSGCIK